MPTGGRSTGRRTRPSSPRSGSISAQEPFERGNLDAGRLGWLLGREVVPAEEPFDPASYAALLRVDPERARASFPEVFDAG